MLGAGGVCGCCGVAVLGAISRGPGCDLHGFCCALLVYFRKSNGRRFGREAVRCKRSMGYYRIVLCGTMRIAAAKTIELAKDQSTCRR